MGDILDSSDIYWSDSESEDNLGPMNFLNDPLSTYERETRLMLKVQTLKDINIQQRGDLEYFIKLTAHNNVIIAGLQQEVCQLAACLTSLQGQNQEKSPPATEQIPVPLQRFNNCQDERIAPVHSILKNLWNLLFETME